MKTDTSEKGLESLIVRAMTGRTDLLSPAHVATETSVPVSGGTGWLLGDASHYDREHCVDLVQLRGFLMATQPDAGRSVRPRPDGATASSSSRACKARSTSAASSTYFATASSTARTTLKLFYGTPRRATPRPRSSTATTASASPASSATAATSGRLALDLGLFINGLPVFTFELKNSLTKQTVADAVEQYRRDRSIRERLFEFGRCAAHFAVDDARGSLLHRAQGQVLLVPPVQSRIQRRRRQPAQPGRAEDRLPLEADPHAQQPDQHPRELRPDRRAEGRPDPQGQARAGLPALPPARRGAKAARRRRHSRCRSALPHPAFSRQRQVQLDRLARPPAHRPRPGGRPIFDSIIVVTDRRILDQQIRDTIKRSPRSARSWGTPSARATCAASSPAAKRSSSRRSRSSRLSSTRSAQTFEAGPSPSSSTRRTLARAASPRRPCH
jgi:type I restriction enzyme R subunit